MTQSIPILPLYPRVVARPSRRARVLAVFRRRVWPMLLAALGALVLLIGLISWGEGTGAGGLGVLLLGALLAWRGGRRLPGGWRRWVA